MLPSTFKKQILSRYPDKIIKFYVGESSFFCQVEGIVFFTNLYSSIIKMQTLSGEFLGIFKGDE